MQQYRCKSVEDPDDAWTQWTDRYSEDGYDFCNFYDSLVYQFRDKPVVKVKIKQFRYRDIDGPEDIWWAWLDRFTKSGQDLCLFADHMIY